MIEMPRSTLNLIRECLAIEGSFLSLSVFQIQMFRIEMQGRCLLPPGKRLLAAPDFLLLRRLGRSSLPHRLVYVVTQQLPDLFHAAAEDAVSHASQVPWPGQIHERDALDYVWRR